VRVALFDIDGTLYPRGCLLTERLDRRITEFVAEHLGLDIEAADSLRSRTLRAHGSTLRGLIALHGVDPDVYYGFLSAVDPRDYLRPDERLRAMLGRVTARVAAFTNAPRGHAWGVLEALGVAGAFERVYTIEETGYRGKPDPAAYEGALHALGVDDATKVTMVEDTRRFLAPARDLGMSTVLVSGVAHGDRAADVVIDAIHRLPDAAPWLFEPA
jgi:putative hydrolase of the HAD superfamily